MLLRRLRGSRGAAAAEGFRVRLASSTKQHTGAGSALPDDKSSHSQGPPLMDHMSCGNVKLLGARQPAAQTVHCRVDTAVSSYSISHIAGISGSFMFFFVTPQG